MTLRKPRNDAADVAKDPLLGLAIASFPGGIEHSEAVGQREFTASDTLPTEMSREDAAILQKFGVEFIGPVEGDALFQFVKLPAGWRKEGTDHAMWSKLLDDKGRERGRIFYKAALYDRRARLRLRPRFAVQQDYDAERKNDVVFEVRDGETLIHSTGPIAFMAPQNGAREEWLKLDELRQSEAAKAEAWLNERFPGWESPASHWSEP